MLDNLISNRKIEDLGAAFVSGAIQQLNQEPILSETSIAKLVQNILLGTESGLSESVKPPIFAGLGDKIANVFAQEFNEGYNSFINQTDVNSKITIFTKKIKESISGEIHEVIEETSQKLEENIKKLRETTSQETNTLIQDVTISALPWIALTTAVVVGVPLVILYLYHRAKRNLDREKTECPPLKSRQLCPAYIPRYYQTI